MLLARSSGAMAISCLEYSGSSCGAWCSPSASIGQVCSMSAISQKELLAAPQCFVHMSPKKYSSSWMWMGMFSIRYWDMYAFFSMGG